jgi:hypothetical protein
MNQKPFVPTYVRITNMGLEPYPVGRTSYVRITNIAATIS